MKTILLCVALGALLFAGSVKAVRTRLQPPAPAPVPAVPALVLDDEEEDPAVEAHPLSRIDLRRWRPSKRPPEFHRFSRAMRPERPAPPRID